MLRLFVILYLSILFLSCGTSTRVAEDSLPEWSSSRPKTNFYYIGIAKVDKNIYPSNYQETAKKLALNDLASEISVKIQSNSLLSTYEDNTSFNSDYQQYVKTETSKDLSGYEMVDSYETRNSYQVYYRLSKSKWTEIQAQRKNEAAKRAFNWYLQAKIEKEQLNYTLAIQYYLNGLIELKKYWSESVIYKDTNQSIQLDKQLKTELLNLLSSIQIKLNCTKLVLNTGNSFTNIVGISILNSKQDLIKDIPVIVSYKKSTIPYRATLFSLKEELNVKVEEVDFNKTTSNFKVEVDKQKILKINTEDKRLLGFLSDAFNVKPAIIPIVIEMPKVFINTQVTKDLKQAKYIHYLIDGIKVSLSKKNIQIVNSLKEADLNLELTTHEIKGPNNQRFKYIYLSYNLDIKTTKNSKLVFTQSYPKIKGADISFDKALEKAYFKAGEEFQYEYAKKLIKGILK